MSTSDEKTAAMMVAMTSAHDTNKKLHAAIGIFRTAIADVIHHSHDIIAKKVCSRALEKVDNLLHPERQTPNENE